MSCRPNIFVGHRAAGACLAVIMVIAALASTPVYAASVAVRFSEGMTHGYLLVRSLSGEILGDNGGLVITDHSKHQPYNVGWHEQA